MTTASKIELIKKLGLSDIEIHQFGDVFLINYLKFHHKKNYSTSLILFLGFNDEEIKKLNGERLRSFDKVKEQCSGKRKFEALNDAPSLTPAKKKDIKY